MASHSFALSVYILDNQNLHSERSGLGYSAFTFCTDLGSYYISFIRYLFYLLYRMEEEISKKSLLDDMWSSYDTERSCRIIDAD